jgi:hypothetical protein
MSAAQYVFGSTGAKITWLGSVDYPADFELRFLAGHFWSGCYFCPDLVASTIGFHYEGHHHPESNECVFDYV